MPKQVRNRPARDDQGRRTNSQSRQPAWKRVDLWALGVSVVALIPSVWLLAGLPTISDFVDERQAVSGYFKSITDAPVGATKPMSERVGIGLAYAAPDSDAWKYAAQLQKQWAAFEYGGAGKREVITTYDEFTSQLCDERDGNKGCVEIGSLKFDDQNRLESFTLDQVPISAQTIPAADGPYKENQDSSLRVTLKGGQRFTRVDRLSLVFEIWNASGSDVTVDAAAVLRDFDKNAPANLVGPKKLVQGQRAIYYTTGYSKNPQWLEFTATTATKGELTYFLPLD